MIKKKGMMKTDTFKASQPEIECKMRIRSEDDNGNNEPFAHVSRTSLN